MEQVRKKVVESGTFKWPWSTSFGVAVIHGGGGGQGGGATATKGGRGGAGGGATNIRVAGRERISADGGSGALAVVQWARVNGAISVIPAKSTYTPLAMQAQER